MKDAGALPKGLMPDLERGRRFITTNPPPGELVQCGITGAHFYGFPSPDSDLDMKGIHLASTEQVLGLGPVIESHDALLDFEGVEHDLTTHEAARAIGLLLRGNGNLLERILSPLQLVEPDEELQALARGCIAKSFASHYRGFFGGMQREHKIEPTAKKMLYSYRVALTGVHLLRTGELVGDLRALGPEYGYDVDALIKTKNEGEEHGGLEQGLDEDARKRWPDLEAALADALESSALPDQPPNRAAFDSWLIARRRAQI